MKKPEASRRETKDGTFVKDEPTILTSYPRIMEYLTSDHWDDGTPREPSQLSFSLYEGGWRLSLNDRELKQSIYTQGDDFVECLELMEGCLQSDGARWYKWNRGKKAK